MSYVGCSICGRDSSRILGCLEPGCPLNATPICDSKPPEQSWEELARHLERQRTYNGDAKAIVEKIVADIEDRSGLGDEWSAIDYTIRDEIKATWLSFISGERDG